ncbi:hypothetical protein X732_30745 [Mesorhizobium sp. L2C066B000]|nr:hypothetical protein X732_30745 [Mesorhizobium sp. L2C066B000]
MQMSAAFKLRRDIGMKVETYSDNWISADGAANVGEEITFRIFELSRGHRPMQVQDNRIGRELLQFLAPELALLNVETMIDGAARGDHRI